MDHRNPDTRRPQFACEVECVHEYVATLHAELPRWGLVVWTAGNVPQRVCGLASGGGIRVRGGVGGVCLSRAFSRSIRPLRGVLSLLKNKPVKMRL